MTLKSPLPPLGIMKTWARLREYRASRTDRRDPQVPAVSPEAPASTLREQLDAYLAVLPSSRRYVELVKLKELSMLHWQVLAILRWCALQSKAAAVELGPYLGAGTIAMAEICRKAGRPLICVEKGGAHPHPMLPTTDILGDLKRNLEAHGVRDAVRIVEGQCGAPAVVEQVRQVLEGRPIDLLVIDADGHVTRDIQNYAPMCSPWAWVVIDDYVSEDAPEKVVLIKDRVDEMVREGRLRELGVYGWGTWVGQLSA